MATDGLNFVQADFVPQAPTVSPVRDRAWGFAPRNVVVKEGEVRLIDFARASHHQNCCGTNCYELAEARRLLELDGMML